MDASVKAGAAGYWPKTACTSRLHTHMVKAKRLCIYETVLVKVKPTINKVHYNSAENSKTLMEGEQFKQLTDGNRLVK